MLYRALKRGFANGKIIEPDEEFDYEGPQGTWMERAEASPPARAEAAPSQATATAPSTDPAPTETTVEDLLKVHATISADLVADQLTQSGYPKKTVLEAHLGHEVPKDVFFNFIKAAAEQRRAAN